MRQSQVLTLPMEVCFLEKNIIIDHFDFARFDDAHHLISSSAFDGDEVTEDETTCDVIRNRILSGIAFQAITQESGEMIGFISMDPSPIVRSAKPMCAAGISVIKKTFRGTGLYEMLGACYAICIGTEKHFYLGKSFLCMNKSSFDRLLISK